MKKLIIYIKNIKNHNSSLTSWEFHKWQRAPPLLNIRYLSTTNNLPKILENINKNIDLLSRAKDWNSLRNACESIKKEAQVNSKCSHCFVSCVLLDSFLFSNSFIDESLKIYGVIHQQPQSFKNIPVNFLKKLKCMTS